MTNSFDYAVRVKTGAGWRRYTRARLLISVGQDYHEGAKLEALVAWMNRNPSLREVHVSVNDDLQRHNFLAAGLPADRAGAVAHAAGKGWIERNAPILDGLKTATCEITRWCEWLERPAFITCQTALSDHERADPLFAEAIERDAHALAERRARRGENVPDIASLITHSGDYVREELAVFALQCAALPAAEVYPGSNLAAAAYLVGRELPEPIRPLATRYFTRIDFARINLVPAAAPRLKIA